MPKKIPIPKYFFSEIKCCKCKKDILGTSSVSEELAKTDLQDTYLLHLEGHGLPLDEARHIVSQTIVKVDLTR